MPAPIRRLARTAVSDNTAKALFHPVAEGLFERISLLLNAENLLAELVREFVD